MAKKEFWNRFRGVISTFSWGGQIFLYSVMPPDYWKIGKNNTLYVVIWRQIVPFFLFLFFSLFFFFSFFFLFFFFFFFLGGDGPPAPLLNDASGSFGPTVSLSVWHLKFLNSSQPWQWCIATQFRRFDWPIPTVSVPVAPFHPFSFARWRSVNLLPRSVARGYDRYLWDNMLRLFHHFSFLNRDVII